MRYLFFILSLFYTLLSFGSIPNVYSRSMPHPHQFIEVFHGKLPIILETPHGGYETIPGFSTNPRLGYRDSFTLELTRLIREKMILKTGNSPEVVSMLASRNYIDVNRNPGPQAYTTEYTKILYNLYYRNIDNAIKRVVKQFGTGLMVSIHCGWNMRYEIEIGVNHVERWSTIPTFLKKYSWKTFHGTDGIGGRLSQLGYQVPGFNGVPRTGGWTGIPALTRCRKEQNIGVDGMMFEFWAKKLMSDAPKREKLANDLAEVLIAFVNKYYSPIQQNEHNQ